MSDSTARDAGFDPLLCPVPPSVQGDDRSEYMNHDAYEIVGDMPVHVGGACYIGRLVHWFGYYGKDGLMAQMPMRLPGNDTDREQTFSANGVRTVASVGTAIGKMTINRGN